MLWRKFGKGQGREPSIEIRIDLALDVLDIARIGCNFYTVAHHTTAELYDLIRRDSIYFSETNGGVTFSGGEPLLHADFIKEFCEKYGTQFNINIETSLFSNFDRIHMLTSYIMHVFGSLP